MGPMSCECIKAILDPRITVLNSPPMALGNLLKHYILASEIRIPNIQLCTWNKYTFYSYGNGYGGGPKPAQQQQPSSGKPVKVVLCERFSQGHCDR